VNRGIRCHAESDCIGGAGVDFNGSAVRNQTYFCIKGVIAQVVYDYFFYVGVEIFDYVVEQVVGHWARGFQAFEPAVDCEGLHHPYDDGEASFAVTLFQDDYLLVGRFVNNYA